jgi:ABC-type transport system involved in multi-copper enzyme maturation permease subunit
MLWYKTWRETRARLLISAITLAWVCFVIVLIQQGNRAHEIPPMSYNAYIWKAVYKGYVRHFFIILVIVLGGGGLLREQAHGTAGFTLALPVSRWRLMSVRAAVGLIEIAFLAVVPAFVITACSPSMHEYYQLSQALQFSVLWAVGGALMFGAAVLLSTVLAEEYSGWIACFLCMMLYSAAVNITALQQFPSLDFFKIMSGLEMPYFSSVYYLLTGPMPWLPLSIMLAIAIGFIVVAGRFTQRRDY